MSTNETAANGEITLVNQPMGRVTDGALAVTGCDGVIRGIDFLIPPN